MMRIVRAKRRGRVPPECLQQVKAAFKAYKKEVEETDLAPTSKQTYIERADFFVRWLDGDFEPGSRV